MKKIIISVLTLFFFISIVNAEERNTLIRDLSDVGFNNLTNSQISDLPYAEYFEKLPRDITLVLTNNKDLSQYKGRHIYIGYGLYDRNNDSYCKYLPLSSLYGEGETVPLIEEEFYNFKRKGEHSYAMSKFDTTYEECVNLTEKYGGYPVVIENKSENDWVNSMAKVPEQSTSQTEPVLTEFTTEQFNEYVSNLDGEPEDFFEIIQIDSNHDKYIIKEYSKNPRNPLTIKGVWLGMYKQNGNCDNKWTYPVSFPSEYENWSYQEPNCLNNNETSVALDSIGTIKDGKAYFKGKWKDVSKNSRYHCLMEVDSPDIKNPYKICAPWWRVDREYDNTATSEEMIGFDMTKHDKSTLPKQIRICSKYNMDMTPQENIQKREVSCSSYYYMKKYEHCLNDPYREVCKVNECKGYIADTCDLKYTMQIEPPMKNYVKEVVLINGIPKEVKVKDNIITYIYNCPPAAKEKRECIQFSDFLIFPATCSDGTRIYGTKLKYFGIDGHPDSPGKTGELDVENSFEGNCPVDGQ